MEGIRILVIEDNLGDFVLIEDYLKEGFAKPVINHASSLSQTQNLLIKETRQYDVILLDLNLPDARGTELIAKVLEIAGDTPLIVLTGYQDKDFGIKTISMGTSDYLLKDELNPYLLNKSITYNIERKRVNTKLKVSEKKYKDLFQLSPLPMWVYDISTYQFLNINDAAIRHYGYTREEFLAMKITDLYLQEDLPELMKSIMQIRDDKVDSREGVVRHLKKNGDIIKVEVSGNVIEFNGVNAELVLATDITSELEKEAKIEKANKRLENAESIACLGYWEHDLKNDTLYWSDEFYSILEIGKESHVASLEIFLEALHPDERDSFAKLYKDACLKPGEIEVEHRVICPNGKVKHVYRKGNLVFNNQNEPVFFESILLDITKRKEEESWLRLQESVITNSSDAVLITEASPLEEPGPRIIFVNEAFTKMTGYSREEVIGRNPRFLHGTDTDRKELDRLKEALINWEPCEIEVINYKKNGNPFWINISLAPVADENGVYTHWISIDRDVTQQKNYVKNLEMHNGKLRDIAWTQSHVVRAPLARIMGLINIINRQYGDAITEKRLISDLESSAKELDLIIRKIVRLAESASINLKE